jgi:hypothetical protein
MAIARYREFGVPVYWIQDSGVVGSIKKASVGLARKYMQRVARELDQYTTVDAAGEKEPIHDFLLLQGVRFAFRVHQVRGIKRAQELAGHIVFMMESLGKHDVSRETVSRMEGRFAFR